MSSSILLEVKAGVASIILNRPDKLNAFNREMSKELQKKLDQCAADSSIRCVYITGNGKAFSAGQDLAEVVGPDMPGFAKILDEHYNPIVLKIRQLEKPVVAGVNGVAAGAGANIALCCDIIVAANSASFIQAFSKIGLIPDSAGSFFLPRLIGWQKASALMMLGEKVSAQEAEKMGMIYKVFADEDFNASALNLATTLAEMPTKGLALTKYALNVSFSNRLEDQLSAETQLQQFAAKTQDAKEGITAFVEKRKPVFKGQ
ncbi:MAG: enoyl-CoA hydratase/isomerase family protein [Bacteroidetes bacterium]|nr:enoyl-CoA hydratase/isomerase family protein [Bacteroidota bacterium]